MRAEAGSVVVLERVSAIPRRTNVGEGREGEDSVVILVQQHWDTKLRRAKDAVIAELLVLEIPANIRGATQFELFQGKKRTVRELGVQAQDEQIIRISQPTDVLGLAEPRIK